MGKGGHEGKQGSHVQGDTWGSLGGGDAGAGRRGRHLRGTPERRDARRRASYITDSGSTDRGSAEAPAGFLREGVLAYVPKVRALP